MPIKTCNMHKSDKRNPKGEAKQPGERGKGKGRETNEKEEIGKHH